MSGVFVDTEGHVVRITPVVNRRAVSCIRGVKITGSAPVTFLIKPGEGLQAAGHGMTECPCR